MKIAIDAWGGDFAPHEILKGVKESYTEDCSLILVGPKEQLIRLYSEYQMDETRFPIEDAPQVIGMNENPTEAVRKKPLSSICRGIQLLAEKKVDAFVSAGSTGAVMAAAWLGLERIAGVERPAIVTSIPNPNAYTLLLDVGANVDCKPQHLLHFAVMGAEYAKITLGVDNPKVGLLSIGEEENKGNELSKATYKLLKSRENVLNFDFIGNVEGYNIVDGRADVVVCDGFTGNALLKFGEGIIELIFKIMRENIKEPASAAKIQEAWKAFDWSEYGGAPLLGVEGVCLICHGKSKAKGIKSAILKAKELAENGIVLAIRERLSKLNAEEARGVR